MKVDVLRGKAVNVRHAAEVSGSQKNISTHHVISFQIDNQPISLTNGGPIHVETGDEVIVAGERGTDGVFYGYSYRNVTRGVVGHRYTDTVRWSHWFVFLVGIVGAPLGVGFLILLYWLGLRMTSRGTRKARKVLTATTS